MREGIGCLEAEIVGPLGEIRQEIAALLTEVGDQIDSVRTNIGDQIGSIQTQMHDDIAKILEELHGLRADLQMEIGGLRMETHDDLRRLPKRKDRQNRELYWVLAGIIVLIAIIAEVFHSAVTAMDDLVSVDANPPARRPSATSRHHRLCRRRQARGAADQEP